MLLRALSLGTAITLTACGQEHTGQQAHAPGSNPGASIALDVRHYACVTAFVQSTSYQVSVNGRFLETGCFEPRGGH
ncbi:hypothetical protein [Streptomyces sp. NPDC004788]